MAKKKISKKKVAKKQANKKQSLEQQQNKQLMVFFTIMLLAMGGILGGYFYVHQQNNFTYAGVDFQKGRVGEVVYYHGKVELPTSAPTQRKMIFNLYLRKDPRKNNIPMDVDEFTLSGRAILSFDHGMMQCDENSIVAHSNLAQFFNAFPWVEGVTGAITDKEIAEERGLNYATCADASEYLTVVEVRFSEERKVEKVQHNCYVLSVGECDYIGTSEKLIMGFVSRINKQEL